jgi:hypothetical protein
MAGLDFNGPYGLALKGRAYVANVNGDQVLVYDPNYVHQAAKSITSGLSASVGVAFSDEPSPIPISFSLLIPFPHIKCLEAEQR